MTDIAARLDEISESLKIAAKPQQENDVAAYIEWHDAVLDILDTAPGLVAALRAVLAACEQLSIEAPNNTRYGRADEIRSLIAAALVSA